MLHVWENWKSFKLLPYIFICFFGVLVFIVPCRKWIYIAEDYTVTYRVSKIENIKDFYKIVFREANIWPLFFNQNPLNIKIDTEEKYCFFDSFYRPGLLLISFIEYNLFGLNAYLIRLLTVLFHILNSLILFYILNRFFKLWISFLCTIIFMCNSTLIVWFGKIDTQQHQIELFFFLLLCLCLIRLFLTKKNSIFLFIAIGMLYLFCISIRETFLITPVILLCLFPLIYFKNKDGLKQFFLIMGITIFVTIFYILVKMIYYPISLRTFSIMNSGNIPISIMQFIMSLKAMVLRFIQDLYSMVITVFLNYKFYLFCEQNNIVLFYKLIKNILLILVAYLFLINKQKIYLLYAMGCIILISWTRWVAGCVALRHYYEALPFVSLLLALLLNHNKLVEVKLYKYFILTFFLSIVLINTITIVNCFHGAEFKNWSNFSNALEKLKKDYSQELHDNPIIVLNTKKMDESSYILGIIEAIQLNFMHNKQPKISIGTPEPDREDKKFKLFCKWVSECKSQLITLLIWNKTRDDFDVKVVPNFCMDVK